MMTHAIRSVTRRVNGLLGRAHGRFRRSRPGSVLIFVIAVLVLVALIATAFISTARTDRYDAAQNVANTEIDMLVEGVVNMTAATIVDDLFHPEAVTGFSSKPYRPRSTGFTALTDPSLEPYEHYDAPQRDLYLARRTPEVLNLLAPMVLGNIGWRNVSWPLVRNGPSASGGQAYQFDRPDAVGSYAFPANAVKSEFTFAAAFAAFGGDPNWPHLVVYRNGVVEDVDVTTPGTQSLIPAADADGDGVADAGLWRLPVGTINGVTYYAAVRVIDNNSAVNANTAFSRDADFVGASPFAAEFVTGGGSVAPNINVQSYFTGRVAFAEFLRSYNPAFTTGWGPGGGVPGTGPGAEMDLVNAYRANGVFPEGIQGGAGAPIDDAAAARADFTFSSVLDAMWSQLARRVGFPGYNSAVQRYQSFPVSDSMALAYRFCLVNPNSSPSPLEQQLSLSLFQTAINTPAAAVVPVRSNPYESSGDPVNGIPAWYERFRYDQEVSNDPTTFRDRRALLVARNPVSNQQPAHLSLADTNSDGLRNELPTSVADRLIPYVDADNSSTPDTGVTPNPPRTAINTASFDELTRAFWSVMAETDGPTPFDLGIVSATQAPSPPPGDVRLEAAPQNNTFNDPYLGTKFFDQTAVAGQFAAEASNFDAAQRDAYPTVTQGPVGWHPARMFRSSLRAVPAYTANTVTFDDSTPRFTAQAMMQLRAAIAAVNAEDLRDSNQDVTARRIVMKAYMGPEGDPAAEEDVEVVLYGMEPQPFITEVYAHTDNTSLPAGAPAPNANGYVAIELYNPYPFDIRLANWALAGIDRRPTGGAAAGTYPLMSMNAFPSAIPQPTVIANFGDEVLFPPPAGSPANTPGGPVVPAGGYLLLENYSGVAGAPSTDGSANYRPASSGLPLTGPIPGAEPSNTRSTDPHLPGSRPTLPAPAPPLLATNQLNVAYVPTLSNLVNTVLNKEVVLMRRRLSSGDPSAGEYPAGVGGTRFPYNDSDVDFIPPGGTTPITANPNFIVDYVPVDSFDMTGLVLPTALGNDGLAEGEASVWYYTRHNNDWRWVYPGRYDAGAGNFSFPALPLAPESHRARQQGTYQEHWFPATDPDPWDTLNPTTPGAGPRPGQTIPAPPIPPPDIMTLGTTYGGAPTIATANTSTRASYPITFPVQMAGLNAGAIGANPLGTGTTMYPFGGFARDGDMLHVPYFGAYRVRHLDDTLNGLENDDNAVLDNSVGEAIVLELNSPTSDIVFVEDTDLEDDPRITDAGTSDEEDREQLGRFVPIKVYAASVSPGTIVPDNVGTVPNPDIVVNDFIVGGQWQGRHRYLWATDLFDYLTVRAPHDDYLPDVASANNYAPEPQAVSNSGLQPAGNRADNQNNPANTANDHSEDTESIDGLININTANWKVLSALPLVVSDGSLGVPAGQINVPLTQELAQIIVYWRDIDADPFTPGDQPHGPFTNLWELNQVVDTRPTYGTPTDPFEMRPGFRNAMGTLNLGGTGRTGTTTINDNMGDTSPAGASNDFALMDFEEKTLTLNRISNLITTRSDSYTCYVLVQGWRDAGTANPTLVVQRRVAFIVDRSRTVPANPTAQTTYVPNN